MSSWPLTIACRPALRVQGSGGELLQDQREVVRGGLPRLRQQGEEVWDRARRGDSEAQRLRDDDEEMLQVTLKPAPGPPKRTVIQQREEEGRELLSRVDVGREKLIVLDERGDIMTSHEFADYLKKCADDGDRGVTFAIGGANGHSEEVQQTARRQGKMISFGKMVMNHQVARVVLFEQLYRAMTIQHSVPYHK